MDRKGFNRLHSAIKDDEELSGCGVNGFPENGHVRFVSIATGGLGRTLFPQQVPNVLWEAGLMDPTDKSQPNLRMVGYSMNPDHTQEFVFEDLNTPPPFYEAERG